MINVSNAWKKAARSGARIFLAKGNIQLANKEQLEIITENIAWGGVGIDEGTSGDNKFDIGAAIATGLTLRLRNNNGIYNTVDFEDAVISLKIGLNTENGIEWIQKGIYNMESPTSANSIINLTCLDNMVKFDTPYSEIGTVYPANLKTIVLDMCLAKGVTLATQDFTNADYVVKERPEDEQLTCRQVLSYVAQISGNFAKCNPDGALELKWYDYVFENERFIDGSKFESTDEITDIVDGGTFDGATPENVIDAGTFEDLTSYHHFFALSEMNVCTDDVVITGIKVRDVGENEFLFGTEGYILSIEDNPLILDGQAETVATFLGQKIVGMKFRPLSCSTLSDPSVEAGDPAFVTGKGNSYACYITNLSYTIGSHMKVSCDAETPSKNRSKEYSSKTKTIVTARKEAQKIVHKYDKYVQQVTSLISQGTGMYITNVEQEDGSTIAYMHDKPTIEESSYTCYHTSQGLMASLDGGTTWAVDKNGNALFNTIIARGVSADWIATGALSVKDADGNAIFSADIDTKNVTLGGWKVDKKSIYSDITTDDGETYRVYVQSYQKDAGKETWIYSVQKLQEDSENVYNAVMYIRGDGRIHSPGFISPVIFEEAVTMLKDLNVKGNVTVNGGITVTDGTLTQSLTPGQNIIERSEGKRTLHYGYAFAYQEKDVNGNFQNVSYFGKDSYIGGDSTVKGNSTVEGDSYVGGVMKRINLSSVETSVLIDKAGYKGNWQWKAFTSIDGTTCYLPAHVPTT